MRRRILALLLAMVMCAALSLPAGAALFPTIVEKDGAYYLVDYDYETGEYEITYLYGHIHKFGNWVVTRMPTCTMTGQQYHTCRVCGTSETETFYPQGTLKLYDFGEAVTELQKKLHEQGFLSSAYVDGQFGTHTKEAVESFQSTIHLTADGIAWPQTIDLLRHTFGEWTVTMEPTYYEPGIRSRTCSRCGFTETQAYGTTLRQGMYGDEVKQLQMRLLELGYAAGTPDGSYGDSTRRAVRSYQTDQGFEADGVCWPGVWNALFKDEH